MRAAIAVTIAGSDSGGGAGIQADIKAMSANGVYAASVITALTAQNTRGVQAIHDVPADFVTAQIDSVFGDLYVDAVKIGMLSQPATIRAVAAGLAKYRPRHVVLDPVMVAASGDPLIADDAVDLIASQFFPLANLVTPNLPEGARLTGMPVAQGRTMMLEQARALRGMGAGAVLLKGGHLEGEEADRSIDLLFGEGVEEWFAAPRIVTNNTHGTGCSLSSAIAAHLALGKPLRDAVAAAKDYVWNGIRHSDELGIGHGRGPIHHFHAIWGPKK
jgi:hydroxymethylpyrimidine/phosphomethylpyrimidine kinase